MKFEDLVFVSVDDHVLEPPNMFEGRLPSGLAERGPKFVAGENGQGGWVVDGVHSPWTMNYGAMRPGAWNADERVAELSSIGILGSLCFPSFPRFAGQLFMQVKDRALGLASVQAYNNWMVEEWAGPHPDRLIPLGLMPLWDPVAMAEEVRRISKLGVHVVGFSENPSKLGLPSIYDDEFWKPFWTACCDEGTVVATHIGSSSSLPKTSDDCSMEATGVMIPLNLYGTAADYVWSNVFRTYQPLKLLLAEGGTGWVPFFLERCEIAYRARPWVREAYGPKSPTEVFREHAITCFIEDKSGVALRHEIGIDNICWEFDYPHGDCVWPDGLEFAWNSYLSGMPDDEVNKITHLNAMRHLRFDPFATRGREASTVGALRASARPPYEGAVTGGFWDSALGEKEAKWRSGEAVTTS
ncbi:amidohydrolase family protein [Streptomyces sp. NPDC002896]|uniref:amidohydrolase family protein n=1 Tax=Streptomyces sp. NPDC002896 TaxID=3154438 RepID=UPI003327A789